MAKNRQENEPKGGLKAKKLEIIYLPASQLSKLAGNPRRDKDPKAVERLAKLIKAHGFQNPLQVYREGGKYTILAGNHRFDAGLSLGMMEFPCLIYTGDKKSALARAISDNRSNEWTEWDLPILKELFIELDTGDFDIHLTGFNSHELELMMTAEFQGEEGTADAEPQIDRAEELNKIWKVKVGDLWQIGEHRMLCGDSTKAEDVARVMGEEKADMVFTDPPYNVASENEIYAADCSKAMADLKKAEWDHDFQLLPALESMPLSSDVTVYVCTSHHLAPLIWEWMKGWADHSSWCVWNKPNPMPSLSKRHWTWNGELIAYATRGKHIFNFPKEGHALSVWTINKKSDGSHPTQKPIEVPEMAISHSSNDGNIIFDGFLGSGTSMVACQNLNRKCIGIEISPDYCAVILQRMADAFPGIEIRRIEP